MLISRNRTCARIGAPRGSSQLDPTEADPTMLPLPLLLLMLWSSPPTAEACLCHVVPNYACPPPPRCCESGQYTFDECGCCMTCAKAELQECGGPSGSKGKCSKGLSCLKTCSACKTISSKPEPCVFPFRYEGQLFDRCTATDAASGSVWCATEVDENGDVIDGRWGDCDAGCPGARRECNDLRFSILVGTCVNAAVPGAIPNWIGAPSYRLLEPTEDIFPAPFCSSAGSTQRRKYQNTCRCASGEDALDVAPDGKVRGNCTGVDSSNGGGSTSSVWCFLENVRDPADPVSGCFPDTTWSPLDGRFWSAKACNGLPAVDSGDLQETPRSIGRKNPLFQAALNTPFQNPEKAFKTDKETISTTPSSLPTTEKPDYEDDYYSLEQEAPPTSVALNLPIVNARVKDADAAAAAAAILPTPIPPESRRTASTSDGTSVDPPAIPTSAATTSSLGTTAPSSTTATTTNITTTTVTGSNNNTITNTTVESSDDLLVTIDTTNNASVFVVTLQPDVITTLASLTSTSNSTETSTETMQGRNVTAVPHNVTEITSTIKAVQTQEVTATTVMEKVNEVAPTTEATQNVTEATSTKGITQNTTETYSTIDAPENITGTTSATTTPTSITILRPNSLPDLPTLSKRAFELQLEKSDGDLPPFIVTPTTQLEFAQNKEMLLFTLGHTNRSESSTASLPPQTTVASQVENRTIDLGILGSFWLQTSKSITEEDEEEGTEKPEPIFNIQNFADKKSSRT